MLAKTIIKNLRQVITSLIQALTIVPSLSQPWAYLGTLMGSIPMINTVTVTKA